MTELPTQVEPPELKIEMKEDWAILAMWGGQEAGGLWDFNFTFNFLRP